MRRSVTLFSWAALVLGLTGFLLVAFVLRGTTVYECDRADPGCTPGVVERPLIWEHEGLGILVFLGALALVAALPALTLRVRAAHLVRVTCAAILLGIGVLGLASIGLFYLPAAFAALGAAIAGRPHGRADVPVPT